MSKPPVRNIILPKPISHFALDETWEDAWWAGQHDLVFESSLDAPEIVPAGSCVGIGAVGLSLKYQSICAREHQS